MKILATYCSALKNETVELVASHKRYKSNRIESIRIKAQNLAIPFFILSGKFGLIRSDQPIPYYDHLLVMAEVESHSKLVAEQIKEAGISKIEFFSRSIHEDPNIKAYLDCMKMACETNSIPLQIIHDTFQEWNSSCFQSLF